MSRARSGSAPRGDHAALVAGAVLTLAPLLWMLSASLMPAGEASELPPRLLPSAPTLEHYVTLFTRLNLARYFVNSLLIASAIDADLAAAQLDGGLRLRQAALPGPRPRLPRAAAARW